MTKTICWGHIKGNLKSPAFTQPYKIIMAIFKSLVTLKDHLKISNDEEINTIQHIQFELIKS